MLDLRERNQSSIWLLSIQDCLDDVERQQCQSQHAEVESNFLR
jgi:hypothetical protein